MPPPDAKQIQQPRRHFAEQRARRHRAALQQLRRGFVDQADAVVVIDHQDAFAQMLHDELIEFGQIGDVDFALPYPLFAFAQAAG